MNKNDFLSLIGSRSPLDRQVLAEISELVYIFPYFQTAHLLLLKGLQDNSDIRFENQLRNSAIHIADREVLHNLLKITPEHVEEKEDIIKEQEIISTPFEGEKKKTLEPVAVTETVEQESIIIQESIAQPVGQEDKRIPEPVFEIPEPASYSGDIEQTVIESAKNSADMIVEIEKSSADISEKEQEESTEQIISHSIMVSVEQDSGEPESGVFIIDDEPSDIEDRVFYMDPGFSVPISETEYISASEQQPEQIPEVEPLTEQVHKVEPLIEQISETEIQPEQMPGAELQPEEIREAELQPEQMPEPEPETVTSEVSGEDLRNLHKKVQADLIDKFISSSPRIEPKREKTDQPVEDLSQQYTEIKGGFVTETLARIYINQGYYSKAIDIYEKLCLKFPEKSGYFATQIEKIKAIIK